MKISELPPEKLRSMALVAQYAKQFNGPVPPGILQTMPDEELDKVLSEAIAQNKPVPGWEGAEPFTKRREPRTPGTK